MDGLLAAGSPVMQTTIEQLTSVDIQSIAIVGETGRLLSAYLLHVFGLPVDELFQERLRLL